MGIPTLHAVVWAVNHLETRKMMGQISLIVSEGLIVPGHFLKVLALGADAVYVGSAILFAVSHSQALNALPFEPPTQVVWNQDKFKERSMGKRSLKELSKKDLVSNDELTAKMIGIPFSFVPWEDIQKSNN